MKKSKAKLKFEMDVASFKESIPTPDYALSAELLEVYNNNVPHAIDYLKTHPAEELQELVTKHKDLILNFSDHNSKNADNEAPYYYKLDYVGDVVSELNPKGEDFMIASLLDMTTAFYVVNGKLKEIYFRLNHKVDSTTLKHIAGIILKYENYHFICLVYSAIYASPVTKF